MLEEKICLIQAMVEDLMSWAMTQNIARKIWAIHDAVGELKGEPKNTENEINNQYTH